MRIKPSAAMSALGQNRPFGQITLQSLFATMLAGPEHPLLEDGNEAIQRVGMGAIADVFSGVNTGSVLGDS